MAPLRVLVAGAGVGGLALAVGLRARGIAEVLVFEREKSLQSAAARSSALALAPNGVAVLRALAPALHLDDAVAAAGEPQTHSAFRFGDATARSPPALKSEADAAHRFGALTVMVRWRALTQLLAAALPAGVVVLDAALASFERLPDGRVRATFTSRDGRTTQTHEADVLVGADGVRSVVRAQLLGTHDPPPRDGGRVVWRAVVPTSPALEAFCPRGSSFMLASPDEGKTLTMMCASALRGLLCAEPRLNKTFRTGRHVGGQEFYWAIGCLDAGVKSPADGDGAGDPAATAALTFASWPAAQAALQATPPGGVLQQRVVDRPPLQPQALQRAGPVTLLGDALHAMIPSLGHGAASALEGALELAQCLASVPAAEDGKLRAALRRYEAARLARASAIQLRSHASGAVSYGLEDGGADATAPVEEPAAAEEAPPLRLDDAAFRDWLLRYASPHAEAMPMHELRV